MSGLPDLFFFGITLDSIVPHDFMGNPEKLGTYMNSLVKENLVTPILPMHYIHKIPNFTKAFVDYVDRNDYPVPRDKYARQHRPTSTIHIEKLGNIANVLM